MSYQSTSLPHTGIATFCKAPFEPDVERVEAEIAVLGIPYDEATAMRPGSRQAPRAIRDASCCTCPVTAIRTRPRAR